MGKRKHARRVPSVGTTAGKVKAAFSQSKEFRERVVSFGVSCCVHVVLMLGLSLIAISTGAIPSPMMLIAAPSVGEDESTLSPEPEWLAEPEVQVAATMDDQPLAFELADLEVSAVGQTLASASPASAPAPSVDKAKSKSPPGNKAGSELDGMQALAAAGIQSRVTKAGGKRGEVQFALACEISMIWICTSLRRQVNTSRISIVAPSVVVCWTLI